jgi:D-tyrosyl-tRNA(Tyr) deacylase
VRAVVQRVASAAVTVDGSDIARIGSGLLILLGVHESDDEASADRMAD